MRIQILPGSENECFVDALPRLGARLEVRNLVELQNKNFYYLFELTNLEKINVI